MNVTVLTATQEHIASLAPQLRARDLAECLACGYPDGAAALQEALKQSTKSWAVLFDDQVAAMVGIHVRPDGFGAASLVWALTGQVVDRARLTFIRTSRAMLAKLAEHWAPLVNIVDARYQAALDWLEVLGFSILDEVSHPKTGAPFRLVLLEGI